MARMREPGLETLRLFIESNCDGLDAGDVVRAAADSIQVGIGQTLLRNLLRTRAYHANAGPLGDNELLTSGAVIKLIREACGMGEEPGVPVERETRKRNRWRP